MKIKLSEHSQAIESRRALAHTYTQVTVIKASAFLGGDAGHHHVILRYLPHPAALSLSRARSLSAWLPAPAVAGMESARGQSLLCLALVFFGRADRRALMANLPALLAFERGGGRRRRRGGGGNE